MTSIEYSETQEGTAIEECGALNPVKDAEIYFGFCRALDIQTKIASPSPPRFAQREVHQNLELEKAKPSNGVARAPIGPSLGKSLSASSRTGKCVAKCRISSEC